MSIETNFRLKASARTIVLTYNIYTAEGCYLNVILKEFRNCVLRIILVCRMMSFCLNWLI